MPALSSGLGRPSAPLRVVPARSWRSARVASVGWHVGLTPSGTGSMPAASGLHESHAVHRPMAEHAAIRRNLTGVLAHLGVAEHPWDRPPSSEDELFEFRSRLLARQLVNRPPSRHSTACRTHGSCRRLGVLVHRRHSIVDTRRCPGRSAGRARSGFDGWDGHRAAWRRKNLLLPTRDCPRLGDHLAANLPRG